MCVCVCISAQKSMGESLLSVPGQETAITFHSR